MWGTEYLSTTVMLFKARLSPHGRKSPGVDLDTMCSGENQEVLDRRIMHSSSVLPNTCPAILSSFGAIVGEHVRRSAVQLSQCGEQGHARDDA